MKDWIQIIGAGVVAGTALVGAMIIPVACKALDIFATTLIVVLALKWAGVTVALGVE